MSQKKLDSGLWLTNNPLILKKLHKLFSVRTPSRQYIDLNFKMKDHTKLKTIHYQQNHTTRIIYNEDILSHSRPLSFHSSLNVFNVY